MKRACLWLNISNDLRLIENLPTPGNPLRKMTHSVGELDSCKSSPLSRALFVASSDCSASLVSGVSLTTDVVKRAEVGGDVVINDVSGVMKQWENGPLKGQPHTGRPFMELTEFSLGPGFPRMSKASFSF